MPRDSRERFVRALQSLSRPSFSAFVAALWTARGWEASAEAAGVVSVRRGREARTLRVVVGAGAWYALLALLLRPAGADAAVTRGRIAGFAVELVAHVRPGVDHLDADDLYERSRYGVGDAERARLWDAHLGPGIENPSAAVRLDGALRRATAAVPASVAATVLLLVVAGAVAGPLVGPSPDDRASRLATDDGDGEPSAGTETATPTATATPAADVPSVCPRPPSEAPPVALRPGVIGVASASGLEGWSVTFEQNTTRFDRNDEWHGLAPESRHVAVYRSPSERLYRLVIDRWRSADRAAEGQGMGVDPARMTVFVWGRYTVTLQALAEDGSRSDARARQLLAAVTTPDGVSVGSRCVEVLRVGAGFRGDRTARGNPLARA